MGSLFETFKNVEGLVHFHNGWGRMADVTTFPYPCGTLNEALEIFSTVFKGVHKDYPHVSVELINHGFLLGLSSEDIGRLDSEWQKLIVDFTEHVHKVANQLEMIPELLKPIFDGAHVAGIIYDNPEGAAFYLDEKSRKFGLGKHVLDQIIERKYVIRTVDDCNVRDFYKKHGFSETFDQDQGVYLLTPPDWTKPMPGYIR
jgi:GNAT superfamily N-acetyltransferase